MEYYPNGMELRLTGSEFLTLASAILDDLNNYASELAKEQKDFKERVGPTLVAVLAEWKKL